MTEGLSKCDISMFLRQSKIDTWFTNITDTRNLKNHQEPLIANYN